jgi:hypothetical protein
MAGDESDFQPHAQQVSPLHLLCARPGTGDLEFQAGRQ